MTTFGLDAVDTLASLPDEALRPAAAGVLRSGLRQVCVRCGIDPGDVGHEGAPVDPDATGPDRDDHLSVPESRAT
jgi:hypothetical protein